MNDVGVIRGGGGTVAIASATTKVDIAGSFEGYASLFGVEDLGHDVMEAGAFSASLMKRGAAGVRMLFQHEAASPIGVWETIRPDARGLYVKGRLVAGVQRADEVRALLRAGALDGLSIGFKVVSARKGAKAGVRRITAVDLWEISVVTFPMLPGARITAVKARERQGARVQRLLAR